MHSPRCTPRCVSDDEPDGATELQLSVRAANRQNQRSSPALARRASHFLSAWRNACSTPLCPVATRRRSGGPTTSMFTSTPVSVRILRSIVPGSQIVNWNGSLTWRTCVVSWTCGFPGAVSLRKGRHSWCAMSVPRRSTLSTSYLHSPGALGLRKHFGHKITLAPSFHPQKHPQSGPIYRCRRRDAGRSRKSAFSMKLQYWCGFPLCLHLLAFIERKFRRQSLYPAELRARYL